MFTEGNSQGVDLGLGIDLGIPGSPDPVKVTGITGDQENSAFNTVTLGGKASKWCL